MTETATTVAPRLSYVVARLDRALRREIEERIQPSGLSVPQFTALSVLYRRDGLSNAQLARRSYITPQSMHEIMRELEDRGLVRRKADPAHRRILRATVTAAGRRVVEACEESIVAMEGEMLAGLSADDRERLVHELAACIHALGAGLPDL